MKIKIGKYSGFCNGVKFTVEQANKAVESNDSIYCLGEIVHNERVIEDLEKKGMKTIHSIEEAEDNVKIYIINQRNIKYI